MILQALTDLYETLVEKGELDKPGWQKVNVSWGLLISEDGTLTDILPLKETLTVGKKQKQVPQSINVPEQVKRSSGVAANYLCDNAAYMLGLYNPEDKKAKPNRVRQCFQECADLHHRYLNSINCAEARSILRFFDTWNPNDAFNFFVSKGTLLNEILAGGNMLLMPLGIRATEVP